MPGIAPRMMLGAGAPTAVRPRRPIDWWLLLAAVILILIGFMSLYSIDRGSGTTSHFRHHLIRFVIGLVPFAALLLIQPMALFRKSWTLYGIAILALLAVILRGETRGGAERWLVLGPLEFQPSELAKLFITVSLAAFFVRRGERIKEFSTFALSLVHVAVPMVLILKQPHLGATLVIFAIWVGVSLIAGMPWKYILGTFGVMAALLVVGLTVPGILGDYHRGRTMTFLFGGDEQDDSYQQLRGLIAFGSGGVMGQGYLKGEFKGTKFVPAQQTDYIATVIGEEGGLIGCALLLAAFGFFFYRVWLVMFQTREPFYKLVSAGIFVFLAFHVVANLGMNLVLLPVVGLWLPFLSLGGTALWLCMGSVGLLLNIQSRRRPVLF